MNCVLLKEFSDISITNPLKLVDKIEYNLIK